MTRDANIRGGSALIVVLWVIGLLSMLIISFAFDAHLETRMTSYYRKRAKAEALANSGVELAKVVMLKSRTINLNAESTGREDEAWYAQGEGLAKGQTVSFSEEVEGGRIEVKIVTEMARRNINLLATPKEWEAILQVADIPEELWPDLIDAFLDWMDPDEDPRPNGAESDDYYSRLEPPYRAGNGPLFTVEELLMVKGFSRAVVYGGVLQAGDDEEDAVSVSGMADLLTTFGDKRVNVNAATRRVLMTIPSADDNADMVADKIIAEREGTEGMLVPRSMGAALPAAGAGAGVAQPQANYFKSESDLFGRVPEVGVPPRRDYVMVGGARYYRIISTGRVQGVKKTIWCTVEQGPDAAEPIRVIRWQEE